MKNKHTVHLNQRWYFYRTWITFYISANAAAQHRPQPLSRFFLQEADSTRLRHPVAKIFQFSSQWKAPPGPPHGNTGIFRLLCHKITLGRGHLIHLLLQEFFLADTKFPVAFSTVSNPGENVSLKKKHLHSQTWPACPSCSVLTAAWSWLTSALVPVFCFYVLQERRKREFQTFCEIL